MPQIAKAEQASVRVLEILKLPVLTDECMGTEKHHYDGAIELRNVSFSYNGSSQILKNINLDIKKRECVAITGTSGCGKSTILLLLQRFFNPSSGTVRFDEVDLQSMDVSFLRSRMALVMQIPMIFKGTILQNIIYGMNEAEVEMGLIEEAARNADVHDFIISLEGGYQTPIDANTISGGQAQRISICRALLRKPKVLLLDECTSALDPESSLLIRKTVFERCRGSMTIVVVTHDSEMMRLCDRVIVIKSGRIEEQGEYMQLLGQKGALYSLIHRGQWEPELG